MSIFDKIAEDQKKSLFKDETIFKNDYAPKNIKEIMCRGDEVKTLAEQITKLIDGTRVEHYIFGTTGIGKTYVVRGVLEEAKKRFKNFSYAWINCRTLDPLTQFQVYASIISQLGGDERAKKGLSSVNFKDIFLSMIEDKKFVLVLDEADALVDKLMYLLIDLRDNDVNLILISNVFEWVDHTQDVRFKSRASSDKLTFKDYSTDQMFEVLKYISDTGVKREVLKDDIIKEISKHITGELMSDVRKGKNLIELSVKEAMNESKDIVTLEHIQKALVKVEPMSLAQILNNFSPQDRLALSAFIECMNDTEKRIPNTDNIHFFYRLICKRNKIKAIVDMPMMKNYLNRLEDSKIISHTQKSFGRYGQTNIYYSDHSIRELDEALTNCGIFTETGRFDELENKLESELSGLKLTQEEKLKRRYDQD